MTNTVANLEAVLRSMATRLDYLPAKALIAGQSLPVSIGWEKTIRGALHAAKDHPKAVEITKALKQSFVDHTSVGEKLVMYYDFTGLAPKTKQQLWDKVCTFIANNQIKPSEFTPVFPLAIYDKDTLRELEGEHPVLVHHSASNDTATFVFCSVRSFFERVPLDTDLFKGESKTLVSEYSELIGVRAIRRQCFDQVIFDHGRELVEVRVDAPEGMPAIQRGGAVSSLLHAFNHLNVFGGDYSFFSGAPFNFHDLMKKLYMSKGEGSVFQLGFTASTNDSSSNNGARLLRKKSVDLRSDAFHRGGANSVTDLSPYSIGVEWTTNQKTAGPQLIILGSAKMLYQSPVLFSEILVRNCYTQSQFGFVSSKIDQHR